jgi:hypothetical protein
MRRMFAEWDRGIEDVTNDTVGPCTMRQLISTDTAHTPPTTEPTHAHMRCHCCVRPALAPDNMTYERCITNLRCLHYTFVLQMYHDASFLDGFEVANHLLIDC